MACGVHAVLSGPAIDRIGASPIEEVVVTNSIPLSEKPSARQPGITVLSVAPLLGEAIRRIHDEESVSTIRFCAVTIPRSASAWGCRI